MDGGRHSNGGPAMVLLGLGWLRSGGGAGWSHARAPLSYGVWRQQERGRTSSVKMAADRPELDMAKARVLY